MNISDEMIAAMAVAVIAEESGITADRLRIVSFKKVKQSPLEAYIEENNISYKKYQLGDR
jgi:hypothetical protein